MFSGKPIFSYRGVVLAFLLITALSFSVWAHHMFATGAVELPFFSVTTEMISIPTGVLFFIWLATLWRGKLRFEPPMLFALGFIAMFLIGGIDGVWAASPAMDFAIHDTYWVVAHLHYVLFGGTLFGVMAAMFYWFPKMTGRMLSRPSRDLAVLAAADRVQPDVLPDAHPRPARDASADRRLPARPRVELPEPPRDRSVRS